MLGFDKPKVMQNIEIKTITTILTKKLSLIAQVQCSMSKIKMAATPAPSIVERMNQFSLRSTNSRVFPIFDGKKCIRLKKSTDNTTRSTYLLTKSTNVTEDFLPLKPFRCSRIILKNIWLDSVLVSPPKLSETDPETDLNCSRTCRAFSQFLITSPALAHSISAAGLTLKDQLISKDIFFHGFISSKLKLKLLRKGHKYVVFFLLGQAIGPLWNFCAPISIIVELQDWYLPVIPYPPKNYWQQFYNILQ